MPTNGGRRRAANLIPLSSAPAATPRDKPEEIPVTPADRTIRRPKKNRQRCGACQSEDFVFSYDPDAGQETLVMVCRDCRTVADSDVSEMDT